MCGQVGACQHGIVADVGGTVGNHLARILAKLGAQNRTEAGAVAYRMGLLTQHRPQRTRRGPGHQL